MNNKQAFIILAKPPILGQVGNSLTEDFSEEQRLKIYTSYLDETIDYFNTSKATDLIISCEEDYQEALFKIHFPKLKSFKVINGNLGERLEGLTHYALSYFDYRRVFISIQEFTFIDEEILQRWGRVLDRNSHSIVLIPYQDNLGVIGLNFPFSRIYEDIVWQKTNVIKQLQDNIKNLHIKSTLVEDTVFITEKNKVLMEHYPETRALLDIL